MFLKIPYLRAIILKICHSFIFTIKTFLMVRFSTSLHIIQVLWISAIIAMIFSFLTLKFIKVKIPFKISRQALTFYLARTAISFISMITWVESVKNLGANESMAISYITPAWLLILAILLCKEKLTQRVIISIVLNTIGVLFIVHPKIDFAVLGLFLALFTTILWAFYDTICKKQTTTEHYILQSFYSFAFYSILTLPFAIYVWKPISLFELIGLTAIGISSSVNLIILFLAYVYAPIVILIPMSYSRLIFTVIFSFFIYNTTPTLGCITGAALIVLTEIYFYIKLTMKENNKRSYVNAG